jgi:hypothetical protein
VGFSKADLVVSHRDLPLGHASMRLGLDAPLGFGAGENTQAQWTVGNELVSAIS